MSVLENQNFVILTRQGQVIDFKLLNGKEFNNILFFSETAIKLMIEEESRRDTSVILQREKQPLRTMSSGERKVAVLKYLLELKPSVLIVEDFYENLDIENRTKLEKIIFSYSIKNKVVQVVKNEKEVFSFMTNFFIYKNGELWPYKNTITSFFNTTSIISDNDKIPTSNIQYEYDYKTFVKLSNVSIKFFDKVVLNNINWEIKLGEFWQLYGENGSGKTTLLSLITGDSHKAYGQDIVLFDKLKGTEENVWEIKQKIGYFTPNITELFNRRHSVLHMVLSGFYDSIGLYVKPLDMHVNLAHQWINILGMSKAANVTFATLTLAEQRLVLIARAMVKHPPLLILDEPTSGLDKSSSSLVVNLINKMARETRTTIIYVSHTLEKGLFPDHTFKLTRTDKGSYGEIV